MQMAAKRDKQRSVKGGGNPRVSGQKQVRQKILSDLLSKGAARTQAELVSALAKKGMRVTQATVSRDLREIGARKVKDHTGEVTYAFGPQEHRESYLRPAKDVLMRRALAGSVSSVVSSGDLVLVKTLPGHAPYVAALIDEASVARVLGTVAGDDTIIVVCEEGFGAVVRDVLSDLTATRSR